MKCSDCKHADCGWCFAGRDKDEYLNNLKDPDFDPMPTKPPEIHADTLCKWVWGHDENFEPREIRYENLRTDC